MAAVAVVGRQLQGHQGTHAGAHQDHPIHLGAQCRQGSGAIRQAVGPGDALQGLRRSGPGGAPQQRQGYLHFEGFQGRNGILSIVANRKFVPEMQ